MRRVMPALLVVALATPLGAAAPGPGTTTPGGPTAPAPGAPPIPEDAVPTVLVGRYEAVARGGERVVFDERRYSPPLAVDTSAWSALAGPPRTPEAAARAFVAAMARGDFDGWLALWDEPARAMLLGDQASGRVTRDHYLHMWGRSISGHPHSLVRRLDLPGAVIVYHRVDDAPPGLLQALPIPVVRGADGVWRVTQSLRDNPALYYEQKQAKGGVDVRAIRR
ncbi:MAG: hypothetical protein KC635_01275 [Myxococcales bacterium]|nr:hypothetical protein [Myxococcales bacterium]MCB9734766.1 hypothetical protein [Deltaproteobacteria bacterium]